MIERIRSLAVRLTLLYAGIFTFSSFVAFFLFYYLIIGVIRDRVDQDLIQRVNALSVIMASDGFAGVREAVVLEAQAAGEKKLFIRLLSRFGTEFSSSNLAYWENIGIDGEAIRSLLLENRPVFETVRLPEQDHSVRIVYGAIGPGIIIQMGQSLEGHTRVLNAYRRAFAVILLMLILLSALIGWFMARQALAGVGRISRVARRISDGDLGSRVPVTRRGDEIDRLAGSINQMLDRIQALVTEIREMGDNIAHDLKSPITRIRGMAEVTLTTAASMSDYEQMAASVIEDCDRLLDMIQTMLDISRTEAGVADRRSDRLDLGALAGSACELFRPLAEDKGLDLKMEVPGPAWVLGDQRMLQRMIANLLDNAIRYTPRGGAVRVAVRGASDGEVSLVLEDSGIGIAPADRDRIFERFYRVDPSRSQSGAGLGLSLARAVARAHQGDILVDSTPGKGSRFTVVLPSTGAG
ncbi:MAG: sensor histidine kinase [Desulfobacterales bacterium]